MTDTQHSQEKEALEDAANRLLTYPGIGQVAQLSYTETTDWITHDDGSVSGTNYGNSVKWSANALAAFAMWTAAQEQPPPTSPPPSQPPSPPPQPQPPVTGAEPAVGAPVGTQDEWDAMKPTDA
jgi:hypothetical protein